MDALENKYKFNIKVTGPISFHLGFYLFRDSNGVLCFSSHKYIYNLFHTYMVMFGTKTKLHKSIISPLEQGDHPELDTLQLLDDQLVLKGI